MSYCYCYCCLDLGLGFDLDFDLDLDYGYDICYDGGCIDNTTYDDFICKGGCYIFYNVIL